MPRATIPIYHDDDFERLSELRMEVSIAERRLEAARKEADEAPRSTARAGDDEPDAVAEAKAALAAAQQAFNDHVDEASERAEMWTLKPIGHEEFRELLKAHPPRKVMEGEGDDRKEVTHPDDRGWELDTSTFPKALLLFIDSEDDEIRTVVEPKFDTPGALAKRVRRLSKGEFESMWTTAYMANEGGVADPKLSRF